LQPLKSKPSKFSTIFGKPLAIAGKLKDTGSKTFATLRFRWLR
jgi:hypothetical protein